MYERMLDKQHQPTVDEFLEHCGNAREMFLELDAYLTDELKATKMLRFPYGNSYGWGMKYAIKSKHICDVFAETDAFTVMLRLSNKQFETYYDQLADDTKECIDHKYPCGDGGWIHDRVMTEQHFNDIKKLLYLKRKNNPLCRAICHGLAHRLFISSLVEATVSSRLPFLWKQYCRVLKRAIINIIISPWRSALPHLHHS